MKKEVGEDVKAVCYFAITFCASPAFVLRMKYCR